MIHKRWALYPGRFQPFHNGHKAHVDRLLELGKNVAIGIRDTELSDANPYTVEQRLEMIGSVFAEEIEQGRVMLHVLPDLEGIYYGRGVGFNVEHVPMPAVIERVSATQIRSGEQAFLPKKVQDVLRKEAITVFFTGLPCSGKTTLAQALQKELENGSYRVIHLDGDRVRQGLNSDLAFSPEERAENLRRVAHLARMFNEQGNTVLCSFIAPSEAQREMISTIVGRIRWVWADCPASVCRERDVKGMWARAEAGEIVGFTGYDAAYEPPRHPTIIRVDTQRSIEDCVEPILAAINKG